jgi:MoaA/NifB/PqqE/SkfB family radical SAM enzyme
MCWFHGERGCGDLFGASELSTQDVLRLIEQVCRHGTSVYLGGGEPFLRQDLLQILESIKSHGLAVKFATNGTLLDSVAARELVHLEVDQVNFSIDGDGVIHDSLRGQGAFDDATGAIRSLVHYRRARSAIRPAVCVNITVSARTAGQIHETIQAIRMPRTMVLTSTASIICGSSQRPSWQLIRPWCAGSWESELRVPRVMS